MPRPFSQTTLRVKIASFDMIDDIIDDLNKQDKNASMSLAKSLKLETAETAGIVSVRFKAKSHWKYVDGGRKPGTRPPIGPLQRWVQVKLGKDEEDSHYAGLTVQWDNPDGGRDNANIAPDDPFPSSSRFFWGRGRRRGL